MALLTSGLNTSITLAFQNQNASHTPQPFIILFRCFVFPLALPANMLFIYLVCWVSATKMTAPCNQGCLFALFRAAKSLVQGSHMSGAK